MAQKACIELTTGPGRALRLCGWALWLLAALVLLAVLGRLPSALAAAGATLLLIEGPWRRREALADRRLRLYRDGGLAAPAGAGSWNARGWSTAWLTVLAVQLSGSPRRILIAAWRNDADDYRLLRLWLRQPAEPVRGVGAGGARP